MKKIVPDPPRSARALIEHALTGLYNAEQGAPA
ncbi:hypothetical protein J3B00_001108 [Pseudomonas sp. BP8]|nr:hypothetical protein [Pseudomonas sp. BP8]